MLHLVPHTVELLLATSSISFEPSGNFFLELGTGLESELMKTESNLACLDFTSGVGRLFPPRERRLLPNLVDMNNTYMNHGASDPLSTRAQIVLSLCLLFY